MKTKYLLILTIIFTLFSCKKEERKLPYYNTSDFTPVWKLPVSKPFHKIRAFSLTDQNGKTFTEKYLDNKISVVEFFFTTCTGICPKMNNSMSNLQSEFKNDNTVQLISHSVTPDKDTVPVLATYATKKNINYDQWKLLTGSKEEIYDLGRKFYFVEEDLGEKRDSSVFLHTENFVLIDQNRFIRGIYNSLDPNSMTSLSEDIKVLEKE